MPEPAAHRGGLLAACSHPQDPGGIRTLFLPETICEAVPINQMRNPDV